MRDAHSVSQSFTTFLYAPDKWSYDAPTTIRSRDP